MNGEASINLITSLNMKARAGGRGKPFLLQFVGADWSETGRRFMQKFRRIDRRGDRYQETVDDPVTGERVHECDEPLSEHWGHGSAKLK